MSKYRRKEDVIEAVQWNKPGDHPDVYVLREHESQTYVSLQGETRWLDRGVWIIKEHGRLHAMSDQRFRDRYEPVTEPASPTPAPLAWTSEPPTVPGYYMSQWRRDGQWHSVAMLLSQDDIDIRSRMPSCWYGHQFLGPLPTPPRHDGTKLVEPPAGL